MRGGIIRVGRDGSAFDVSGQEVIDRFAERGDELFAFRGMKRLLAETSLSFNAAWTALFSSRRKDELVSIC
ncbi:MAG: hypothetical protein IJO46_05670 [Thermoguttaceae bacterium]|nr:hypothetical protein [Thermoguttaceae bacterium]